MIDEASNRNCGDCNYGVVDAIRLVDKIRFIFLCNCSAGQARPEKWPRWSIQLRGFAIYRPETFDPPKNPSGGWQRSSDKNFMKLLDIVPGKEEDDPDLPI